MLFICAQQRETQINTIHPYFLYKIVDDKYYGYIIKNYCSDENNILSKQYDIYRDNPNLIIDADIDGVTTIHDFMSYITRFNLTDQQCEILEKIAIGVKKQRKTMFVHIPCDHMCNLFINKYNIIQANLKLVIRKAKNVDKKYSDMFLDIINTFSTEQLYTLCMNMTGSYNGCHKLVFILQENGGEKVNYHISTCTKSVIIYITPDIDNFQASIYSLGEVISILED